MFSRRWWIVWLLFAIILSGCGGSKTTAPPGDDDKPGENPFDDPPSPLTVELVRDEGSAKTQAIALEGGTIQATGKDGTVYTLVIPEDALLEATSITMTPLAEIQGFEVEGAQMYGVDLQPDGLQFYQPITLTISPPGVSPSTDVISFMYDGSSKELYLYPLARDLNSFTFNLFHFSAPNIQVAQNPGDNIRIPVAPEEFTPSDPEARLQHKMEQLLREEREALLKGEAPDPDFEERVQGLLGAYYHDVILPMLPKIASDCTYAENNAHKAVSWTRQVALIGAGFEAERQTVLDTVAFGISNCWIEAVGPCINWSNASQVAKVLKYTRMLMMAGGYSDMFDPQKPEYACKGWSGTATKTITNHSTGGSQIVEKMAAELTFIPDPEGGNEYWDVYVLSGGTLTYERSVIQGDCTLTTGEMTIDMVPQPEGQFSGIIQISRTPDEKGYRYQVVANGTVNATVTQSCGGGSWETSYGATILSEFGYLGPDTQQIQGEYTTTENVSNGDVIVTSVQWALERR
jgi:hypothetical protein